MKAINCCRKFLPLQTTVGGGDASYGIVLTFEKGIKVLNGLLSNVWLNGDIRDIKLLNFNSGIKRILVSRNNDRAGAYFRGFTQAGFAGAVPLMIRDSRVADRDKRTSKHM